MPASAGCREQWVLKKNPNFVIFIIHFFYYTVHGGFYDTSPNNDLKQSHKSNSEFRNVHRRMAVHKIISFRSRPEGTSDAFLALKIVDDPNYKITDNAFPHNEKYRINGFPKDAFHIAFILHKTRLKNILRSPGIDPIEKDLLNQRFVNLSVAQNAYVEKQKKVM